LRTSTFLQQVVSIYCLWTAGTTWFGASVCFENRDSLTNGRLQPSQKKMKARDDRAIKT